MREHMSRELARVFAEAESERSCAGVVSDCLRKAIKARKEEFTEPVPQLFARASYWAGLSRPERVMHILRGLHGLHPDWVFCGPSAAAAWGLSVSYRLLDVTHVATSLRSHSRSQRFVRRHVVDVGRPEYAQGLPVTPPDQTVLDCMCWSGFADGLAVADSALHTGLLTYRELNDYVSSAGGGRHGIAQARMTASFASDLPENGGESIARATMHELGFTAPRLQVDVPNPFEDGPLTWRVDFHWTLPDGKVVYGELDGGEKYANRFMNGGSPLKAIRRERRRESRLTVTHAAIARFSPDEVADLAYFDAYLRTFGIPKDHKPLVAIPAAPPYEQVPLEAYGL